MKARGRNIVEANTTTTSCVDVSRHSKIEQEKPGYASKHAPERGAGFRPGGARNLLLFFLLVSATAAAQKNQISLSGMGNFNPITYIYLYQPSPAVENNTVGSSQKSSLGGSAEYDRWFSKDQAFGLEFEQNPSDGKLLGAVNRKWYIWPQMRTEVLGMFTQEVRATRYAEHARRFTSFIQEGAGAVMTDEYGDHDAAGAGWSHSIAIALGAGTNYWVSERLAVRISSIIIGAKTGCYDDPGCRPTWGASHDIGAGFSWKW